MNVGSRNAVVRGAAWIGSSRVLVNIIALISTLILARLLVPSDFGLVALAGSIFAVIASVTELSLVHSLIQHPNPREHHYNTAWTLNAIRSFLLAIFIAALAAPAAELYGDERLVAMLFVLAGATAIGGLENPKLVVLQRDLIFWQDFVLNVASKIAGFVVAITLAYIYRSFWALVLGSLAAQTMRVIVSYVVIPYLPRPSFRATRELLSFSIWLTLSNGLRTANWQLDPLILGFFLPTSAIGHYTVGDRLAFRPVKESLVPLRSVLFPAFSRMQGNLGQLRAAYLKAQGLVSLLAMPIGFGLAVIAEPVVRLAMGDGWLPLVPVVRALAILSAVQAVESSQPLAMSLGRTQDLFGRDARVFLLRMPLVIAGLFAGSATEIGPLMGAIYGRAGASLINITLNLRLIRKLSGISLREQLFTAIRPLLAGLVMAGCVFAIANLNVVGLSIFDASLLIFLAILIGATSYILSLAVFWALAGRPDGAERELTRMIRQVWNKRFSRRAGS